MPIAGAGERESGRAGELVSEAHLGANPLAPLAARPMDPTALGGDYLPDTPWIARQRATMRGQTMDTGVRWSQARSLTKPTRNNR